MKHIRIILFSLIGLFIFQVQTNAQSVDFGKVDLGFKKNSAGWTDINSYFCSILRESRTQNQSSFNVSVEFPYNTKQLSNIFNSSQTIPTVQIKDANSIQTILLENAKIVDMGVQKSGTSIVLEAQKLKFMSKKTSNRLGFHKE